MSRVRLTRLEQLGRRIADLLQGHHGSLSDLPGGGTNESHGPSMLHEEAHRVRGVQQHPRQMPKSNARDTSKGSTSACAASSTWEACSSCARIRLAQICW